MNRSPSLNDQEHNDAGNSDGRAAALNEHSEDDDRSDDDGDGDGEFGDDFDDFEKGSEGDDFGDFDGFQQGEGQAETAFENPPDHHTVPASLPGPVSQEIFNCEISDALLYPVCGDVISN